MKDKQQELNGVGVVYLQKEEEGYAIEVSFRSIDQAIPGGSMIFTTEEGFKRAFEDVEERYFKNKGVELPPPLPENLLRWIYQDAEEGIGFPFHCSLPMEQLLVDGRPINVYRNSITGSHIPKYR